MVIIMMCLYSVLPSSILCTTDPGLSSTLEDLFSVLANNAGCHANFHRHFLPSAVQLLDCANKEGNPLALVAVSERVGEGECRCELGDVCRRCWMCWWCW